MYLCSFSLFFNFIFENLWHILKVWGKHDFFFFFWESLIMLLPLYQGFIFISSLRTGAWSFLLLFFNYYPFLLLILNLSMVLLKLISLLFLVHWYWLHSAINYVFFSLVTLTCEKLAKWSKSFFPSFSFLSFIFLHVDRWFVYEVHVEVIV